MRAARVPLDLPGRRIYVEWGSHAPVTPLGRLVYLSQFPATAGLFTEWGADCPLHYSSPNAPQKADVLGTIPPAVLAGNRRCAPVTAPRGDTVNPQGFGMSRVMSQDAVRRAFQDGPAQPLADGQQGHPWRSVGPVLSEPWMCDPDVTVKTVYGRREGAEVGCNPHKPGRLAHAYHTFFIFRLRLALDVVVAPEGTQPSLLSVAPVEPYEYVLLVTNPDWETAGLGRLYRERADSENTIDELKRQWGWGGFVTRDLLRCQVAARNVALICNWWSLVVRRVEPERAREAVTSRPLRLSAIGREVRHAGQTTVALTSMHAEAGRVRRLLSQASLFLSGVRNSAEPLSATECWARIGERILRPFRVMEAASRAWFGQLARLPGWKTSLIRSDVAPNRVAEPLGTHDFCFSNCRF